jgi:hypothetical protein
VGDVVPGSPGEDFEVPPRKLTPAQSAFYDMSGYFARYKRLDPEEVAAEAEELGDEESIAERIGRAEEMAEWLRRYGAVLKALHKRMRRESGNLRVVGGDEE